MTAEEQSTICWFCNKPKPDQAMEKTPDGENICLDCLSTELELDFGECE